MKETPIIFNSDMVRAVLNDRKTQTRRIVSPRHLELILAAAKSGEFCPLGQVGDRLWVRETYQGPLFNLDQMEAYLEDASKFERPEFCEYRADGGKTPEYYDADDNLRYGWKPSIHMPRWASRITLEITGVSVERLNDISEADARAEGVELLRPGYWRHYQAGWTQFQLSARGSFVTLWKSLYSDASWSANPWVWVVEFQRIKDKS